jgi:alkylhydroperoxidase family enzyme
VSDVPGTGAGRLEWLAEAGLEPVVFDQLVGLEASIWSIGDLDAVLLEFVRIRIAQLVQAPAEVARRTPEAVAAGLDEATVADLASWPTSPRFDDRDRAVLAWTEQCVLDASVLSDDDAAMLTAVLSQSECATLMYALALFEALARTRAALALA